jgi:hypothetical protein
MCVHCDNAVGGEHEERGGITRRQSLDFLAAGGFAALLAAMPRPAFTQPADDVVRIGYLPILLRKSVEGCCEW